MLFLGIFFENKDANKNNKPKRKKEFFIKPNIKNITIVIILSKLSFSIIELKDKSYQQQLLMLISILKNLKIKIPIINKKITKHRIVILLTRSIFEKKIIVNTIIKA